MLVLLKTVVVGTADTLGKDKPCLELAVSLDTSLRKAKPLLSYQVGKWVGRACVPPNSQCR